MVALSDLVQVQSPSAVIALQLQLMTLAGMPASSWQAGSVPLTLIQGDANTLASLSQTVSNIAAGGLISSFTGPTPLAPSGWLDLIASSHYGLTRKQATGTTGVIVLTDAQGAGPFTITPGQLLFSSQSGQFYTNTTGGTLPKGLTLPLTVQSQLTGSITVVGNNSITTLNTPLPGVTVNNPDQGIGTGTWITATGSDAESDQSLAIRCIARWPGLGGGATALVYQAAALGSGPGVTKAKVLNGLGLVTIYVAGAGGGSAPAEVLLAQTAITAIQPLCVTASVVAATNLQIPVNGTYSVKAAQAATAVGAIYTALQAYQNALQVGDTVVFTKLIQTIMDQAGVTNLALTAPLIDTPLASNQVAVLLNGLTGIPV